MGIFEDFAPRIRDDRRKIDGEPLSHVEKLFFFWLLTLDIEHGIHMTLRQLETNAGGISDTVISRAIPRLRAAGYIRADKLDGTRESWSIWLGDVPPAPEVSTVEYHVKGVRITIRVEPLEQT